MVRPDGSRSRSSDPRNVRPLTRTAAPRCTPHSESASSGAEIQPPVPCRSSRGPATVTSQVSPAGIVATRDPSGSPTTSGSIPPSVAAGLPTRIPILISGSCRATGGAGTGPVGVRLAGTDPDTQLTETTSSRGSASRRIGSSAAVIAKLELDSEILAPKKGDHPLQFVPRGSSDPHLVSLNGSLHLLEALVLDRLDDALRRVLRNALCQLDRAANTLTSGCFQLTQVQIFSGHTTLDHLRLQHIDQGLHAVLVVRAQSDFRFGPIEIDGTVSALEVITLSDLLDCLIHCVVDLLQIGTGGAVK